MECSEALRRRRMVRSFDARPVAAAVVDRVLDAARRGPSAGFSQGVDLLVLVGSEQTARYWRLAFPEPSGRARFRWQGLFDAPVLVVPLVAPQAYLDRYREADKAGTARGELSGWPVPYWWIDGGMAVMAALLAAVDEGLGALFFDLEHPDTVLPAFGVPPGRLALGTIALGHPGPDDGPNRSSARPRRSLDDVVHRGHW
ncbi:MAG: nitroreductase family protein [Actinobacteria bacterium]|nr:nitroreductase family protein [Actinomycetota bacterium]